MVPTLRRRFRLPHLKTLTEVVITRLERRRSHQLVALVMVSTTIGALTAHLVGSAHAARERWAGTHEVLVTTRVIESGTMISASAVRKTLLPTALTPDDALSSLPTDARLSLTVEPRTVLTAALLEKDATIIPESWRTVAIPDDVVTPPLVVGQRVDVVGGGVTLTEGAIVSTLEPLTVAVDPSTAAQVAAAARVGEVSLVAGG